MPSESQDFVNSFNFKLLLLFQTENIFLQKKKKKKVVMKLIPSFSVILSPEFNLAVLDKQKRLISLFLAHQ